jgi:two-component system, chemotaxis family, sensor kinase CheA
VQNIVILQADGRQFGLIVDEINDTEEIVVKPLGKHFKGLPAFAGATIMGDGRVALILDVLGLARMAHVVVERGDRRAPTATFDEPTKVKSGERRSLLLVQIGERGRAAIPLNDVARLEELGLDTIEWTSGRQVVQYRGEIMPLVSLSEELGHTRIPREDARSMHVVVYSDGTRRVGIVVDKILDIVDEEIAIERSTTSAGIEGRAVVQGRVTDLVDIAAVVTRYHESVGV